jgi:hypothetical protein
MSTFRLSAWVAVAAGLSGCGLIDPDIGDFALRFPTQSVTVDSSDWELTADEEIPAIECADVPGVCNEAVLEYCAAEGICFGSCDGAYCEAAVVISLWHTIDLAETNHDEFQRINDQPVISVNVDDVAFSVGENTFNIPSPELGVYVAPRTVMNHGSPQARLIGTIPALSAGARVERDPLQFTDDGRDHFEEFLAEYRTPFNIIVGGRLDLAAGDVVPQGRMQAEVHVTATARP